MICGQYSFDVKNARHYSRYFFVTDYNKYTMRTMPGSQLMGSGPPAHRPAEVGSVPGITTDSSNDIIAAATVPVEFITFTLALKGLVALNPTRRLLFAVAGREPLKSRPAGVASPTLRLIPAQSNTGS